jgi:hypothetical protein
MMRNLFRMGLLVISVSLGMGLCQSGWAQDYEEAAMQLEMRERGLSVERIEAEMAFQKQMRGLELEARRVEIDRMRDATPPGKGGAAGVLLLCLIANILMAVWVYTDNRRRETGYGIWIVITLLVGFFGALVYAVIRLGDTAATAPAAPARSSAARK